MTAHEKLRALLFGDGIRNVNMAELSRKTGIPRNTLEGYREEPTKIPAIRFVLIAWAVKVDLTEAIRRLEAAVREAVA